MKLFGVFVILYLFAAFVLDILAYETRPYDHWKLTKPDNESGIIPDASQTPLVENEILHLLKRSSRNSSIKLTEPLKFKINFPQVYKDYLVNTTIAIVPYHWERIYNVSIDLNRGKRRFFFFIKEERISIYIRLHKMKIMQYFQCSSL